MWCRSHLGDHVKRVVFAEGYLSTAVGVRLSSGRSAVVKVRPWASRLDACYAVHRHLFERGYPCPEPLVGLCPFGPWVASAEAMVVGGQISPTSGRDPSAFAAALYGHVVLTPALSRLPSLDPPLPWTGPDGGQSGLWPWPDDRDVDLNTAGGPEWIDDAGRAARMRLEAATIDPVAGHGDWYTGNLRWSDNRLHVAWDWDSVIAAPEPVLAGLAAAVFPATVAGTEATIDETQSFLDAYGAARGRPLSREEIELAWAAGLWNRSFDAKKQIAVGDPPRSLTNQDAAERARRAGVA